MSISAKDRAVVNAFFPGMASEGSEAAKIYNDYLAKYTTPAERMADAVKMQREAAAGSIRMANNLQESAGPLNAILAAEAITAAEHVLAPFDKMTMEVQPEVSPTSLKHQPTIAVEVDLATSSTQENPQVWGPEASSLSNTVIQVNCQMQVTQGSVTAADIINGSRWRKKLKGMILNHCEYLVQKFGSVVAAAVPSATTAGGAKTLPTADKVGRYVPMHGTETGPSLASGSNICHLISPLFGQGVEALLLNPDAYAYTLAFDQLGLPPAPGRYGVGEIYCVHPWPTMDTHQTCWGIAMRQNAIAMGVGTPLMDDYQGFVTHEPLGEFKGIPMWLKVWLDPRSMSICFAVVSLVGMALANPAGLYILADKPSTSAS